MGIDSGSLARIAAESADLVYVVVGTVVALGMPFMPFWRDVHRANMAKEQNPAGGKPIKPEGWIAPNPQKVLYRIRQHPEYWDDE